tara:strand:- start:1334 stop:1918 length:585 start_codon:yes stop_codon:yes gene_type:complete
MSDPKTRGRVGELTSGTLKGTRRFPFLKYGQGYAKKRTRTPQNDIMTPIKNSADDDEDEDILDLEYSFYKMKLIDDIREYKDKMNNRLKMKMEAEKAASKARTPSAQMKPDKRVQDYTDQYKGYRNMYFAKLREAKRAGLTRKDIHDQLKGNWGGSKYTRRRSKRKLSTRRRSKRKRSTHRRSKRKQTKRLRRA